MSGLSNEIRKRSVAQKKKCCEHSCDNNEDNDDEKTALLSTAKKLTNMNITDEKKKNQCNKTKNNQQKKGSKDQTTGDEIHVKTRASQVTKYKENCLPHWQQFYLCYHTMLWCTNHVSKKFPSIKNMDHLNAAPPAVRMILGKLLFEDFEHVLRSIYHNYQHFRYLRELYLWKNFVSSQFLVHSFQKKGTIMIDTKDKDHSAYLVKGLYESLEELISRQQSAERATSKSAKKTKQFKVQLPIVIETVLLPFQEGISYNTTFTIVKKSAEELNDMKKEYAVYYENHVRNKSIIKFQQLKGMDDIHQHVTKKFHQHG